MESFSSFLITKKFPSIKTIRTIISGPFTALSTAIYGLFFALCVTVYVLLIVINNHFLITVPARGGTLTEGVIGAPHNINPLLAATPTDKRLTALVYTTLNTITKDSTVSPDGKIYTVELMPNLRFDDNKPLTSADVVFTVQKMQDSTISQNSDYWQNISVENPDATTVVFTLPAADTSFGSRLAFGILPQHIWQNIDDSVFATAPQNLHPVGAGPFKVADVIYENNIPASVILKRNTRTIGHPALLKSLTIESFANQAALVTAINARDIDFSYSVSPDALVTTPLISRMKIQSVPTAQTVSLYHSKSDTVLANPMTIASLSQIIDKNAIIATVQHGYGISPESTSGSSDEITANSVANTSTKKLSINRFSIAVENDPSLLLAAETLVEQLAQQGITVSVRAFDPGSFQKNVAAGAFTIFLARNNDWPIPAQYSIALPLYTESVPYVFTKDTHTSIIANTLASPTAEYDDVTNWYTHTDKLWKIHFK